VKWPGPQQTGRVRQAAVQRGRRRCGERAAARPMLRWNGWCSVRCTSSGRLGRFQPALEAPLHPNTFTLVSLQSRRCITCSKSISMP
jgi:hypothetical protein